MDHRCRRKFSLLHPGLSIKKSQTLKLKEKKVTNKLIPTGLHQKLGFFSLTAFTVNDKGEKSYLGAKEQIREKPCRSIGKNGTQLPFAGWEVISRAQDRRQPGARAQRAGLSAERPWREDLLPVRTQYGPAALQSLEPRWVAARMALPNLSALLFLKKEKGEPCGESERQSTPRQVAPSLQMLFFFFNVNVEDPVWNSAGSKN